MSSVSAGQDLVRQVKTGKMSLDDARKQLGQNGNGNPNGDGNGKAEPEFKPVRFALTVQGPSREELLEKFKAGKISADEVLRQMTASSSGLQGAVSAKGALSVYGLNAKWPVTLYPDQWERLLSAGEAIRGALKEHKAEMELRQAIAKD
jgi:hypothetical protein